MSLDDRGHHVQHASLDGRHRDADLRLGDPGLVSGDGRGVPARLSDDKVRPPLAACGAGNSEHGLGGTFGEQLTVDQTTVRLRTPGA